MGLKSDKSGRNEKQKKVLVVAYAFPPVGGAGVQRPAKFVKYLRGVGWEPYVLTCLNPSVPVVDYDLLKDLPDDIEIFKTRTIEPSYNQKLNFSPSVTHNRKITITMRLKRYISSCARALLVPDMQVLWWPGLILALVKILKTHRFNCVFVTAPPFSSFIPVIIVCNLFRVPVVVDFRDEWIFNRLHIENASKNIFARIIDNIGEKYVVSGSAAIVAATSRYIHSLKERHPNADLIKMFSITNGYDADDFVEKRMERKRKDGVTGKIVFVYTGTVWSATSLKNFVSALRLLFIECPEMKNKVLVKVLGRVVPDEHGYLVSEDVQGNVFLEGYCSHDTILEEILSADVLLLTLSSYEGAERIIPAKTFEYMATGNRILAMLPAGEAQEILSDSYSTKSTFAHPDDPIMIKDSLVELVSSVQENKINLFTEYNKEGVKQFSREVLTEKLANVFNRFCRL